MWFDNPVGAGVDGRYKCNTEGLLYVQGFGPGWCGLMRGLAHALSGCLVLNAL
jgi:hypothetical protein